MPGTGTISEFEKYNPQITNPLWFKIRDKLAEIDPSFRPAAAFPTLEPSGVCFNPPISDKDALVRWINAKSQIEIPPKHDPVNHPKHYTSHPSGVECIEITRHMNFNLGNVIKYIWRAGLKEVPIQDLEKAAWYLNDEITKRKSGVL